MAANAPAVEEPKKRRFNFPTAYTILAIFIVVFAILTFVIPAGKYDTDENGAPIPGTYHAVESNPQNIQTVLLAPINGMYGIKDEQGYINVYNTGALYGAIDIAMFILMIGGFLGITMKTGAIDAGITTLVKRLGTNGRLLIPIMMIVFAAGGTSYGMAEESLAFYPLIIALRHGGNLCCRSSSYSACSSWSYCPSGLLFRCRGEAFALATILRFAGALANASPLLQNEKDKSYGIQFTQSQFPQGN